MSDYTLNLEDDWDLHVTDDGNLPTTSEGQGVAQNVANAFRLFTNDAYYFGDKGVPHFLIELKEQPRLNVLKSRLKRVALQVEGVKDCEIKLMAVDEDRALNGFAVITLDDGSTVSLAIAGL